MTDIVFQRPVDGALFMFNKGYKVFPIIENGKTPSIKGWQDWAESATEKKIRNYGIANPMNNWGIHCGPSKLAIIDLDIKPEKGIDGAQALKLVEAEHGTLNKETLTILTPSKGQHLYYNGECKNSVSSLGQGIDTRGVGGYVVAPGSRIDDEYYTVINDSETKQFPTWVNNQLGAVKKESFTLKENATVIEGERNQTLAKMAGIMRRAGFDYEAIYSALVVVNNNQVDDPLPEHEVQTIARSISNYKPEDAKAAADFAPIPKSMSASAGLINPLDLPKRDWIMEDRYVGGFVSVIVAPGGVGKSTVSMLDAVSVATGKALTGFKVAKPGAVWIYNTEDPTDELKRRMTAIATHHGIKFDDIANVRYSSGRDQPLMLAKQDKGNVIVNQKGIDSIVDHIKEHNIVLFLADPFVRTHSVSENDNMQIDKVVGCFQNIATRTGCAIGLVHHTSKGASTPGDMDKARGASALVNAARIAHTLQVMTEKESTEFCIPEDRRRWYVRLDNAKANFQAPASNANWYEKISVKLFNGDTVGTIEKSELVDLQQQKVDESKAKDNQDILGCVGMFMNIGDKISIREAHKLITTDPQCAHLMPHDMALSGRRGIETLVNIIKDKDYTIGEKRFKYLVRDNERPKHWVVCERNSGVKKPRNLENVTKLSEVDELLS